MAGALGAMRRAALCAAIGLTWAGVSRADDSGRTECASAYEQGQELRSAGKLHAAEEILAVCAAPTCPAFIHSDCTGWLDEVDRAMPTLVFAAKDADGNDTLAVKVTVDGAMLLTELDGKPASVDPGPHRFRFELEGADPIDMKILVRESEKDRVVRVNFEPPSKDLPLGDPYAALADSVAAPHRPGPLRPFSYAAGGVGAAGVLGWAVLGLIGRGEENRLDNSGCRPHCSVSDVDSVRTKYIAADVLLGVGIAALGAGVALFFVSQPKSEAPKNGVSLDLGAVPLSGGAYGAVTGRF